VTRRGQVACGCYTLLFTSLGLAGLAVAGQTFRTGVDAVAVDVLVTRGGQPVVGLDADDFVVLDNGIPQQIEAVLLEDVPITLLLVLDTSGSVRGAPLVQLRTAAEAVAGALRADDRVGLVTFSHNIRLVVEPPSVPARLTEALGRVRASGGTALYDATFAGFALRERMVGRTLMLVFSDGDDTTSWLDPRDVLKTAQRSDVVVYGVSLDRETRDGRWERLGRRSARRWFPSEPYLFRGQFLPVLAGETGGSVFVAQDVEGLQAAFARVLSEFRSRYLLTYSPTGVEAAGWHELDVQVDGRGRDVQARRGYLR
jgi:VWFA-related protein